MANQSSFLQDNVFSSEKRDMHVIRVQNFFLLLVLFNSIALAIQVLLPSYLNFKSSEALSARIDDGAWCDPQIQGIGLHCFGDFYYSLQFANEHNPWSGRNNNYPPLATAFYKPFSFIDQHFPNSHISLLIYLLFGFLCVMFPIAHATIFRKINWNLSVIICLITLSSAPILMAFDRGNIQIIIFPFIYLFTLAELESNYFKIMLYGMILILFKPQMILLGAIFLAKREIRKGLLWLGASFILSLSTFLIYPVNGIENLQKFLGMLRNYQQYTNAGSPNPTNVSIANTWSILERLATVAFPSFFHKDPLGRWDFYPIWISIVIIILIFLNLFFFGAKRIKSVNLFIVLSVPVLIPNVSFAYYLCIYSPLLLLILIDGLSKSYVPFQCAENNGAVSKIKGLRFFQSRTDFILFSLFYFITFIPWAIPWKIIPYFNNLPWSSIGVNWFPGQIILLVLLGKLLLQGIDFKLFRRPKFEPKRKGVK